MFPCCASISDRDRINKSGHTEREGRVLSPLHIHCGNVKGDSLKPQHHKETLRERTVADALTIASCLGNKNREYYNITVMFPSIFLRLSSIKCWKICCVSSGQRSKNAKKSLKIFAAHLVTVCILLMQKRAP